MFSIATLLLFAAAFVAAISLLIGLQILWYNPYKSPLRHLRGPKGMNLIIGNWIDIAEDQNGMLVERWMKEYGNTFRFKGFMNDDRLFTADTRTINHILTHNDDYEKSPATRRHVSHIAGEGLIFAEGAQHRQQRHAMNLAFGPAPIRALTETFLERATRLRDLWSAEITKDSTGNRIDVIPGLSRMTLDIIGRTGFNYDFGALDKSEEPNELSDAFAEMFAAKTSFTLLDILQELIPALRVIPSPAFRKTRAAQRTVGKIGKELLKNAQAAALASGTEKRDIDENNLHGRRDLLSLLVKATMASDTLESDRLSDRDVIAQIPTFLVAGHETISTAITWALYAMTCAPKIQTKLRDELLSVDTDTPSMEELMALPYLDAVMRETLRVHPPVPLTERIAMKDDALPVEKPYTNRYGAVRDTIAIAKGDLVIIPILAMNLSEELWGPDSHEFKPERWYDPPETVSRIPGVWGNLMTFIGGPRACIGYRFALVEFKAILFTLVRAFEFELAVPASEVRSMMAIVQRPVLRSDPTRQPQLPLLVRPHERM